MQHDWHQYRVCWLFFMSTEQLVFQLVKDHWQELLDYSSMIPSTKLESAVVQAWGVEYYRYVAGYYRDVRS